MTKKDHPPKIAILGSRGIPAGYGGFETFSEELSVRLVQKEIEVTVYCEKNDSERLEKHRGINLVYISAVKLGPLTTILFDLRCLWHARKNYDVVYMLGYGASIFCFIPRLWGSRVWINMDGIEWARSKWSGLAQLWFKIMEAFAMRTPCRIIADAEGIRLHLANRFKRLPSYSIIPYGASVCESPPEPSCLKEWGLEPGTYYIVVCRLEPENHVLDIIRGFIDSGSSKRLLIIGNHLTDNPYIRNLLKEKDSRIFFAGSVYDKLKLQTLRYHAAGYFHGHSVGGTNPSLLEAMGCGNIIIAHDNIFNREVAGDIAFYFKGADDIPDVIKKVEAFSQSEKSELKVLAQERIKSLYDWDDIAVKYIQLINERKEQ